MPNSADKLMAIFPRDEWDSIANHARFGQKTSVNISRDDTKITKTWRVALLFADDALRGLALVRRRQSSGSFDNLIEIRELREIETLPISKIEHALGDEFTQRLKAPLGWNRVLPPVTGIKVLAALEALRPGAAGLIAELRALQPTIAPFSPALATIREQRDAVALGLELSGMDSRAALGSSDLADDLPFLRGLSGASAWESATIRHDATRFPGWVSAESRFKDVWHWVDPEDSRRQVTVLYADKLPLEATLGTDLLYYRKETGAFVLVQYKRMTDQGGPIGAAYRPDKQLDAEIDRFKKIGLLDSPPMTVGEARLSADPFYLKLVDSEISRPDGNKLAKGMYFPLDLFQLLRLAPESKGPKGGVYINRANASRYLTNGTFVDLVRESWIGTRGDATAKLSTLVNEILLRSRGIILVQDETPHSVLPRRERRR